jgi:hypothetical protein
MNKRQRIEVLIPWRLLIILRVFYHVVIGRLKEIRFNLLDLSACQSTQTGAKRKETFENLCWL